MFSHWQFIYSINNRSYLGKYLIIIIQLTRVNPDTRYSDKIFLLSNYFFITNTFKCFIYKKINCNPEKLIKNKFNRISDFFHIYQCIFYSIILQFNYKFSFILNHCIIYLKSILNYRKIIALCTNATVTGQTKPLIIHKYRQPRCFGKSFNSAKSWMTMMILEDWLVKISDEFRKRYRNTLFLTQYITFDPI